MFILFCLFGFVPRARAITPANLLSENLFQWFDSNSSATPDPDYFGAWVMRPVGDKLYLGLGRDVPDTESGGGPILASFDGTALNLIGELAEDNVNRMKVAGSKIYIPGYDPHGGWDAGDLYIYDTETEALDFKRYRYPSMHFVDATTTDENGNFSFSGLKPTAYQIKVIKPTDYVFSSRYIGSNRDIDNNVDAAGVDLACSTEKDHWGMHFTSSFSDNSFDAGLRTSAGAAAGTPTYSERDDSFYTGEYSMGNLVWHDLDSDGIQDAGEPGMAGVRVELYTRDPYFPCAIHGSGLYVDSNNEDIYYNLGYLGQEGTTNTMLNYTIYSPDGGENWDVIHEQRYEDFNSALYYASDFTKIGEFLYRTQGFLSIIDLSAWTIEAPHITAYSLDGVSWNYSYPELELVPDNDGLFDIYSSPVSHVDGIINFHNKMHLIDYRGHKIYSHTPQSGYLSIPIRNTTLGDLLPAFKPTSSETQRYNSTTTVGDEYLYALGDDQKVYVTSNLRNWAPVADFAPVANGAPIISLVYWPEMDWIVVSTAGANGSLYAFDHSEAVAEVMGIPTNSSPLTFKDAEEPEVNLTAVGGYDLTYVEAYKSGTKVATFSATLNPSCNDWSTIAGDASSDKAFIANVEIEGCTEPVSEFFVPLRADSDQLRLCPDVSSLEEITTDCVDGITVDLEGEVSLAGQNLTVSTRSLDSADYWIIAGSSDLGGWSYDPQTIVSPPSPSPTPPTSPTTEKHDKPEAKRKSAKSSGHSPSAPGCSASKPSSAPDLFQINAQADSVTLFFSPVSDNRDRYFVSYSTNETAEEHGIELVNDANGVIAVDIGELQSNTTYYFKVRAGNGCQPGDWSNNLAVQTGQPLPSYRWSSLPQIVSTGVAGTIEPSSIERIEAHHDGGPEEESLGSQEDDLPIATPSSIEALPQPEEASSANVITNEQPGPAPEPELPSLLNRVYGFFQRLFGR